MLRESGSKVGTTERTWGVRARRQLALTACASVLVSVGAMLLFSSRASELTPAATSTNTITEQTGAQSSNIDFSRFGHTNPNHARLPCLLCHRREGTGARAVRTGHMPCSGCHTQQFADQSSPVCGICHTNPPAKDLRPFPPLRSFNVRFDHARHTTGASRPGAGCVACHRPAQRGVALSIPTGLNAHSTCYQCHGPQAKAPDGQDISSCGTCHNIGQLTRTPTNAPAYQVNFSHARHTAQKLSCTDCHRALAGAPARRQVTAPQPLMHHARAGASSCATCHNGKRAFGGDDFTACTRCHQGTAWHF